MASRDVYAEVTDRIIRELEKGTAPWVRPWRGGGVFGRPRNLVSGHEYRGVNVLLCWLCQSEKGYRSDRWLTFRQAKNMGAHVKKGEKGLRLVFFRFLEKRREGADGAEKVDRIPIARTFVVFNTEQVEGLEGLSEEDTDTGPELSEEERIARCETFVRATGARITYGGGVACYSPATDTISMPEFSRFRSAPEFYATAAHELTHWTAHPSRLDRKLGKRFGDAEYAMEELVAELGAAFTCADMRIEAKLQHAEYIGHWLQVLRQDKRAVFTASRHAEEAAGFLAKFRGDESREEAAEEVAA